VLNGEVAHLRVALKAECPQLEWVSPVASHCRCYADRPQTCQDFPTNPEQVRFSPCSYWFEDEHGHRIGGSGATFQKEIACDA
jgi:Fe-S-cluster containining protein